MPDKIDRLFFMIDAMGDENSIKNLCKYESDLIRYSGQPQKVINRKFEKYRSFLKDKYYKDKPNLKEAIMYIDSLVKEGQEVDNAIKLTKEKFCLINFDLNMEYVKYFYILSFFND